jgi:integrase/recombinase XerD
MLPRLFVLAPDECRDTRSGMAAFSVSDADLLSSDQLVLRAAIPAFLGRYRGQTRLHTNSDLRVFLRWCDEQNLPALAAVRTDIERYVR